MSEPRPSNPAQPWTLRYDGLGVESISADADGIYVAMGSLADGAPKSVGDRSLPPDLDGAVGVRIGHDGELQGVHAFEGDTTIGGLNGSIVTLESWASIEVGDEAYAAPSREAVFGLPSVAVAVKLGTTTEVLAVAPDVESARSWPLAGGQLLMAAIHRDETDETSTELQLFVRQRAAWSTSVPDREVTAVLQTARDTWVAIGNGFSRNEVRSLDLQSGELSEPVISVSPARGHDLSISALTEGPRAWGSREGLFVASPASLEFVLHATGSIVGLDDRDVLIDVYHLEPDRNRPTVDATGTFLLRDGVATRVGPAVSHATLTPTHVVHNDDCDGSRCIRAVSR